MKKYISIIGIMIFLVINSNVYAQEDAYKEYQKQINNKGKTEEAIKADSIEMANLAYNENKNLFSYSLGTYSYYTINQFMFNYRRSLFKDTKLDVGVNLTIGCNYTIDLPGLAFSSDPATFLASASVSIAYVGYSGVEFNFGEVYFQENNSFILKEGRHFFPYFSALYVHKFRRQPLVFKIGVSYPYLTYLSIGVSL